MSSSTSKIVIKCEAWSVSTGNTKLQLQRFFNELSAGNALWRSREQRNPCEEKTEMPAGKTEKRTESGSSQKCTAGRVENGSAFEATISDWGCQSLLS